MPSRRLPLAKRLRTSWLVTPATVFNGELIELIDSIRRDKEQTIDHESLDTVIRAEWEGDAKENAEALAKGFPAISSSEPRRNRSPDHPSTHNRIVAAI